MRRRTVGAVVGSFLAVQTMVVGIAAADAGAKTAVSKVKVDKAAFTTKCKSIRSKYKADIPSNIEIAVSPYNPPSESVDPNNPNKIIGLEPSMVTNIANCLGFTYTYSSQAFATVISSLQSGRNPMGITAIYDTPAREQIIGFVPYRTAEDELVTTPALVKKLKKPMDLCGYTTGVTTGGVEQAYMQQQSSACTAAGKSPITINVYQDIATIFASLAGGHIDFTANAAELTPPVIKQYPGKLAAGFLISGLSFVVGIGIDKSKPTFGQAVAAAVKTMQATDVEKSLLQQWGYPLSTQKPASYVS